MFVLLLEHTSLFQTFEPILLLLIDLVNQGVCIHAYRLNASVNWWEFPSLKAFTKIKMLTLIHVKNRVHLILYAKLI